MSTLLLAISSFAERCAVTDRSFAQRFGFASAAETVTDAAGRSVNEPEQGFEEQKVDRV